MEDLSEEANMNIATFFHHRYVVFLLLITFVLSLTSCAAAVEEPLRWQQPE